ncbi:MAG: hypothetical protein WBD67_01525 [Terracidiphilus sp.]
MNAQNESNTRKSIVAETLRSLSHQANLWHDRIDLIEAGQPINRVGLMADFGGLLELCQDLRDAVLSEESGAKWTTKDELLALVDRLDGVAAMRSRYLELAHLLSIGTVVHHRERTRVERLQLRDAAVAELMEISGRSALPELPGPSADAWLHWACGLEDGSNDPGLVQLQGCFPRLDDFVRQLDIRTWQDGVRVVAEPASSVQSGAPRMSSAPEPQMDWNVDAWRGTADARLDASADRASLDVPSVEPAMPIAATATAVMATAPMGEMIAAANHAAATAAEPAVPTPMGALELEESSASVAVAVEAPEETEESAPTMRGQAKANGEFSFFPEEELESFSLYLEKAKRETKDERKVRALFAISHWLNPIDQNPLSHPKCGIRARVDYSGATDMVPSSPAEASKAISTHNKLLLFTGGADLLRWSLSQPSNGHFDALATVRRLSIEHIRTWFHQMYRVELAEPQLNDIYRLTSGIPLLVGEMHRLIVPDADAPPSWLGFELWTSVLTNFGNRLPAIAHELTSGSSGIRLTEREVEVLKMMVIASDEFATPESLVCGLTTDWSEYRHAEFLALSESDAESVALLERLGILPTCGGSSSSAIEALVPLEQGDALRQVVRYL